MTEKKEHSKLEVHGRARREAARRRNSEWKVNLGIRNSSRNNATCRMTPNTVPKNHVAYVIASAYSVRARRLCQYLCPYLFRLWTKVHHVA